MHKFSCRGGALLLPYKILLNFQVTGGVEPRPYEDSKQTFESLLYVQIRHIFRVLLNKLPSRLNLFAHEK